MFLWWTINIFLLIIIGFLFLLLSMFWPPDSPWAPWWRTNKKTARAMCRLAKIDKEDIVYDLGSGTGTALGVAAKEFGASGVGIEIDPLRFIISTLMIYIIKVVLQFSPASTRYVGRHLNFYSFCVNYFLAIINAPDGDSMSKGIPFSLSFQTPSIVNPASVNK